MRKAAVKKEKNVVVEAEADDFRSLLEKEQARRVAELPMIRPGDVIDIPSEQLQILKDIFDSIKTKNGDTDAPAFFTQTRRNPVLRQLNSTLARDPDGASRIPRETFQQVFDRMETELKGRRFTFSTVVEYFTKRGRPLTKDDVKRMQDEDK